jgi:predicted GNAT family acetyltransferase
MAARTDAVAGVSRVQAVYTPPERRRAGYAAACVAALSARVLAEEHRCILYTDLTNPTSNGVYRSIGYRSVAEWVRYRFH